MFPLDFAIGLIIDIRGKQVTNLKDVTQYSNSKAVKFNFIKKIPCLVVFLKFKGIKT